MKKKFLLFVFLILIISISSKVYATVNKTFINSNGVELTDKEYKFINDFYGENYFMNMTQEDYEWISDLDINNRQVEINAYHDVSNLSLNNILTKGPSYETNSKKISIARSCDTTKCTVITNLTWLTNPTIRSYDVIGARFNGTSLYTNNITTKVSSSSGTTYFSNNRYLSNGFGTSVKLPTGATNIIVNQKFYTNIGGNIYASYQHATSNISLPDSYYYTISPGGLGGVFNFYGNASGIYDGMGGVNI